MVNDDIQKVIDYRKKQIKKELRDITLLFYRSGYRDMHAGFTEYIGSLEWDVYNELLGRLWELERLEERLCQN